MLLHIFSIISSILAGLVIYWFSYIISEAIKYSGGMAQLSPIIGMLAYLLVTIPVTGISFIAPSLLLQKRKSICKYIYFLTPTLAALIHIAIGVFAIYIIVKHQ
jgi:hypothetical protein